MSKIDDRILIYTPFGKDGVHVQSLLEGSGFACQLLTNAGQLAAETLRGALTVVTSEEILGDPELEKWLDVLAGQPTWSALPVLVFYSAREDATWFPRRWDRRAGSEVDVQFMVRPLSAHLLLKVVRSAARDRHRQYRTRTLLGQLEGELEERRLREAELERAHQAALEAREAAESASTTKSQFLANMSHEIRTPLGAITGFAELLAEPGTSPEDAGEFVAVIRRNSAQLLRIVDDILDLSKVESGKIVLEMSEFSPADLISDCLTLLGLKAREAGTTLTLRNQGLPERIVSDPTRLRQILNNVVGNAVKFTRHGTVELVSSFDDGMLTFTVRDEGVGISADQQAALFQPFVQADASTTRKFGGTGLGLVLTRGLCQALGGDFFLAGSRPDEGSTFVASVRVEVASSRSASGGESGTLALGDQPLEGWKVLLVEDSPDNQVLLSTMLRRAGAVVELARDGVEGVEKGLAGDYSLILMDLQMPRMGGLEAVALLRDHGLTLPIVALTAHAMREERERALAAGFSNFLSKPVELATLLSCLTQLAGRP